jgi:predicted nucleotidyltransferase
MISQTRLRQILKEYRTRLEETLGEDLDSIVLYGSQARGDAVEGSDIDVLCVMKRPFDYGELILRTSEITSEISLKYDVVLSRSFARLEDYKTRQTPFLMNVRREGVAV